MTLNDSDIEELRKDIDIIDRQLISNIIKRQEIAKEIINFKVKNNIEIEDKDREAEILIHINKFTSHKSYISLAHEVYKLLFKNSKKLNE